MKMYVLVRRDLTQSQQAVQSCHAVAEFMLHHGTEDTVRRWASDDRFMIILGVSDEAELKKWQAEMSRVGVTSKTFIEPDMGDQATAMAIHPTADRRMFRKLSLL